MRDLSVDPNRADLEKWDRGDAVGEEEDNEEDDDGIYIDRSEYCYLCSSKWNTVVHAPLHSGEEQGPAPHVDIARARRPGGGMGGDNEENIRWPRPG